MRDIGHEQQNSEVKSEPTAVVLQDGHGMRSAYLTEKFHALYYAPARTRRRPTSTEQQAQDQHQDEQQDSFHLFEFEAALADLTSDLPLWRQAAFAMQVYLAQDDWFHDADVILGFEPFWLGALLFSAFPKKRFLFRLNMCAMLGYWRFFGQNKAVLNVVSHILFNTGWIRPDTRKDGREDIGRLLLEEGDGEGVGDGLGHSDTENPEEGEDHDLNHQDGSNVVFSAATRISAEMFYAVYGRRPLYIPMLGLHASLDHRVLYDGPFSEKKNKAKDVLLFRSRLPYQSLVMNVLAAYTDRYPDRERRVVTFPEKTNMEFKQMAENFAAVVLMPHVPNALRLSDMTALGLPMLIPAEPYVYRVVWPLAGCYCGHSDSKLPLMQTVMEDRILDPLEDIGRRNQLEMEQVGQSYNHTIHTFDIFHWQSTEVVWPHKFHEERRYWYQYTEWKERGEVLIQFRSIWELFDLATATKGGNDRLFEHYSQRTIELQEHLIRKSLPWWRIAVRSLMVGT
ncbi:unnamed protein product [Amoebophrya sp. A25]|nr:unnamed protein product [Amoebophrya sp. A25]|eukprot:GSA25T00005739001.1